MFADAINCTHNGTGGSGTITLAGRTGYPQPSNVWGTSLTKYVNYSIAEYTDSTFATLSKYERGVGSLVLSTNVLTRTIPRVTWTSGGSYNASSATALTFGNTAANIIITLTATANSLAPGIGASIGFGLTYHNLHTRQVVKSGASTIGLSNGTALFFKIQYESDIPITTAAVYVSTFATGSLRLGIYDCNPTTDYPGNLISELTSSTQIDTGTSNGAKSVTPSSPLWLPNGWYWVCLLANAGPSIWTVEVAGYAGMNSSSGTREYTYNTKAITYGALSATGPTSFDSAFTYSSNNQPWVGYK